MPIFSLEGNLQEISALRNLMTLAIRGGNGDINVAEAAVVWARKCEQILQQTQPVVQKGNGAEAPQA